MQGPSGCHKCFIDRVSLIRSAPILSAERLVRGRSAPRLKGCGSGAPQARLSAAWGRLGKAQGGDSPSHECLSGIYRNLAEVKFRALGIILRSGASIKSQAALRRAPYPPLASIRSSHSSSTISDRPER
jgi:hypothetical protein